MGEIRDARILACLNPRPFNICYAENTEDGNIDKTSIRQIVWFACRGNVARRAGGITCQRAARRSHPVGSGCGVVYCACDVVTYLTIKSIWGVVTIR